MSRIPPKAIPSCRPVALAQLRIRVERLPEQAEVLRIARARNLFVYDAAYLELAYRDNLPLATRDRRLGEAARLMGVELFADGAR